MNPHSRILLCLVCSWDTVSGYFRYEENYNYAPTITRYIFTAFIFIRCHFGCVFL
jgi:hypothetical protein